MSLPNYPEATNTKESLMQKNPAYKVEHYTTDGQWVQSHEGTLHSYTEALALKGSMGRVLTDVSGEWEVVDSFPSPGFAGERSPK